MDFATLLPQLSVGVVAVLSLAYVTREFLKHLDKMQVSHQSAMTERETALRAVEADVRKNLTDQMIQNTIQMTQNTVALSDTAKVMGRVIRVLDGNKSS